MLKALIEKILSYHSLTRSESESLLDSLMSSEISEEEMGSVLLALKAKEESKDEILGFMDGLSKRAIPVAIQSKELMDVCGTGGDGAETFNVSTGVALVLASMGVKIAKHGNRGVSSKSGSSDVLTALGIGSETNAEAAAQSLYDFGLTFLFAPAFHPAFAKLAPVRKKLGVYTVFNVLGPLLNPAPITRQLMGVYDEKLLTKVPEVLKQMGLKEIMVVHGSDGLDEFTLSGSSSVVRLSKGKLTRFTVTPEEFGLKRAPLETVKSSSPEESASILLKIFQGEHSPKRDLLVMNAAAGLVLSGKEINFKVAAERVGQAIDAGKTYELLKKIQAFKGIKDSKVES